MRGSNQQTINLMFVKAKLLHYFSIFGSALVGEVYATAKVPYAVEPSSYKIFMMTFYAHKCFDRYLASAYHSTTQLHNPQQLTGH